MVSADSEVSRFCTKVDTMLLKSGIFHGKREGGAEWEAACTVNYAEPWDC